MFKKKSKNPKAAVETVAAEESRKKVKGKKANGMSQVLHESVAATVEEELIKNETFTTIVNGEPRYVALELNVDDIGGLDKKSRKVEAKGALIEAINSGHLASAVTPELMNENRLVLLPDANTIFNMLDYGILRKNPDSGEEITYRLVYVDASGATNLIKVTPVEPECRVTLMEIGNLMDTEGSVSDLIGNAQESEEEETSGMDDFFAEAPSTPDSERDIFSSSEHEADIESEEDIPYLDEDAGSTSPLDDDNIDDIEEQVEEPEMPTYQQEQETSGTMFDTGSDAPEEPLMEEEPEQEVPAEWVTDTRMRKFFSDDLGLEISVDPFDSSFLVNNMAPQFLTDRPSGWLSDQLNEMSRQANMELQHMHETNLFNLKKFYFNLVSRQVERIARDLDVHDPSNPFGHVRAKLNEARAARLNEIETEINHRKNDMDAAWTRKLQEVGQDAARRAQASYREHYGAQHEADIRSLPDQVRASIEADYEEAKMEINERRRAEATKLLDLCITEVLEEISDRYASMLADENARYRELEENMRAFIEDNRSNDIARTNALTEELRQHDKVRELMSEHASKVEQMRADFAAERTKLETQIDNIRSDNKQHLADVESRATERLNHEKERNAELQKQLEELRAQNEKIYAKAREEYAHQLEEKNSEIAALHDRQKEAADQQKRSNKLAVTLIAAIAICAIGIGFILGTYIRLDHDVKDARNYAIEEYQPADSADSAE